MRTITDTELGRVCDDVKPNEAIGCVIEDMFTNMTDGNGIGLAANQIGVRKRIIAVNYKDRRFVVVNPVIEKRMGGRIKSIEGCLSFPGKKVKVLRFNRVVISGLDADMNPVKHSCTGMVSRIVQHEIDHLNGVTMFKRARLGLL